MACNNCPKRKMINQQEIEQDSGENLRIKAGPTGCQCEFNEKEGSIFCERHQIIKTKSLFELCKQRHDYFQLWEEKRGPFQNLDFTQKKKEEPKPPEKPRETENKAEKSKGLGDTLEKFTKATGIKKVVDVISKAIGKDCGCENRKEWLNNKVPYAPKKTKGFFE